MQYEVNEIYLTSSLYVNTDSKWLSLLTWWRYWEPMECYCLFQHSGIVARSLITGQYVSEFHIK